METLNKLTGRDMGYNYYEFLATLTGAKEVVSVEGHKNLMAWFAYEEVIRIIANELG